MRPTPRRVRAPKHAAYVRSNNVLVQDQERKQRVAYAPSRVRAAKARTPNLVKYQRILGHPCRAGAMPEPSEAPTHFGQPRAVRAAYRNLVKHQRILGIPNLSATCGVRPLPAVFVRDRRCVGRACKNRHEHTLAKTVTNTRAGSVLFSIPNL